ncbi:response regulator [Myxococcota bacterium]|nr:response regulator [Myxococcota bacterium]
MNPYLPLPHDLVFFLQGLATLLTGMFLFWTLRRFVNRPQGQYFIAFLGLSSLHAWLHMLFMGWTPGSACQWPLIITQLATGAALAMSGYRVFVPVTVRPMLRWLPLAFYLLLGLGLMRSTVTYFMLVHLAGGLLALALAVAGLLRGGVLTGGRPLVQRVAFMLLLVPVLLNAIAPYPIFAQAWGDSLHRLFSSAIVNPEMIELVALLLGMGLLHFDARPGRQVVSPLLTDPLRRHFRIALISILAIIASGWLLMGRAQIRQDREERAKLLQAIRNASLAFSAREIALLSGSAADQNHLTYLRIKGQLQDLRKVNPGSRFLYLMGSRNGRIFFFADSEPADSPEASPPGQVYEEASAALRSVFERGREVTEGPLPDSWGIWVSGLVPIREGPGSVVAVLGMDVDASSWQKMLFKARFPALTVMWLGCLLILGAFIYMRKTTENAMCLMESENKYRTLFEESADAHFLMVDGFTDCNAAACRLLGYPREEIIGRQPWDFSPEVQKDGMDSRKQAMDYITRARNGQPQAFSWDHRTRAGDILHTDVLLARHGSEEAPGLQIIVRDRTDEIRRRDLERRMEARLSEVQRWEGLANLAGGVAHDFNNLITSIVGNVHLIQMEGRGNPRVAESLDAILESSRLATELARQMLAYAGKSTLSVRPFQLGQVLENMEKVLKAAAASRARIETEIAPDLPAVLGDTTHLQQVILNLVINAMEAIDRRNGVIHISVARAHFTQEQMLGCVYRDLPAAGEYVVLTVRDNGKGIPADVLARIFEPFYTTKFTGRGLGLAAVLGIVHNHSGAISVQSAVGTGTVFEVRLPASRRLAESKSFRSSEEMPALEPLRILIAEDEDSLLTLAQRILERHGHTVFCASDGEAALALARQHGGQFDLVIADVLMPGMSGLELVVQLKQEFGALPVLLTSGHVPEQNEAAFAKADGFLPKPYHYKDLFKKIYDILHPKNT